MAKGFKTGGRDFVKGVVTNPHGTKRPREYHLMKQLNRYELKVLLNRLLTCSLPELETFGNTVIEVWLARSVAKGIKYGDMSPLMEILQKLVPGELVDPEMDEFHTLLSLPKQELLERGKEAFRQLETKEEDDGQS